MSLFVGLDVGTQGCKAVVYDDKLHQVVSRGSFPYDILKSKVPGRAEQHPSLWIEVGRSGCTYFIKPTLSIRQQRLRNKLLAWSREVSRP